ncbi:MAG: hypothetical protein ACHRHE_15135 [Tepidisphaerales bacterium]
MPTTLWKWLCMVGVAAVGLNAVAAYDPTEILLPFQLNGPWRTDGMAIVYGDLGDTAAPTTRPARHGALPIVPDDSLASLASDLSQSDPPEPDLLIETGPETWAIRRPRFLGLVGPSVFFNLPCYDWIAKKDLAVVVLVGKLIDRDDDLWIDRLRQAGFRRAVIKWEGGNWDRDPADTVVNKWSAPDDPAPAWRPSPPFLQLPSIFPQAGVSESDADLLIELYQEELHDRWPLTAGNYPVVHAVSITRPDTAISASITEHGLLHHWLAGTTLPRRNLAIITLCDPISSRDELAALIHRLHEVGFTRIVVQRPMAMWNVVVLDTGSQSTTRSRE